MPNGGNDRINLGHIPTPKKPFRDEAGVKVVRGETISPNLGWQTDRVRERERDRPVLGDES